jgi:hypothetical protein
MFVPFPFQVKTIQFALSSLIYLSTDCKLHFALTPSGTIHLTICTFLKRAIIKYVVLKMFTPN